MKRLTVITLVLAAAIAGCGGPSTNPPSALLPPAGLATPSPTVKVATNPAEIIGTWKGTFNGSPAFLIFGDAGKLTVSLSPDGSGGAMGQYFFEDTRLALRTDLPFRGCDLGSTAYYEARLEQQGAVTVALKFSLIEDACVERVNSLVSQTPAWVRP